MVFGQTAVAAHLNVNSWQTGMTSLCRAHALAIYNLVDSEYCHTSIFILAGHILAANSQPKPFILLRQTCRLIHNVLVQNKINHSHAHSE